MAERKTYTVSVPGGLNLRAAPDKTADIVRVLKTGEKVIKVSNDAPDGWMAVKGGYVMREFLK